MRRRGANSCEAQNRHASAANPKFAQVCGALGCELRVQKRHYKDRVASGLIDSEVRTSAPKMLTNFGIGTLVPRNRSSHKFAERSDANFGFRSGTTRIELLVSLSIPKFVRARRKCLRTSETLVPRTRSSHKFAERSDANFGFRSGTTRIELLVSLSIPKLVRACRKCLRTSESGH